MISRHNYRDLPARTKDDRMRILMIAPQPFFEPRGTPLSVYQRLWALSQLNHKVDLLTFHVGVDISLPNVQIHRIVNIPFIKSVKIGPSLTKLFLDFFLFWYSFVMLARKPYDVLHTHEEASFWGPVLARLFGCQHVYDMHSSLPQQLAAFNYGNWWPINHLFELMERWVINASDAIITVDDSLTSRVLSVNPDAYVSCIENMSLQLFEDSSKVVPSEVQSLLRDRIPIVYTGTFERYQGLSLLLSSMKQVVEEVPDVLLVLVGGKPDQVKKLQAEVDAQGLGKWVYFSGILPPEEALAYLEVAEVLVSPRLSGTSIPLKIYSYLRAGKAIVATNIPSNTQILNEDNALIVEPTTLGLASGLLSALGSSDLRKRLGGQASQQAQRFNKMDDYVVRLGRLYKEMQLSEPRAGDILKNLET